MSMSKKTHRKIGFSYKAFVIIMLVVTVFLAAVGIGLHVSHESSVLDIYSEQQDAYVQLVLDQINVLPEKTDEEIITNILGSLDTSNRKYWALAKNQMLLFVKDVTETNRYKGFTTPTLFESESASQFMKNLQLNHVTHKIIEMDEEKYVASGVVFEYSGSEYKICLLTNETVILDNNAFLSSQIGLYIFLGMLLLAVLLISLSFFHVLNGREETISRLRSKTERLLNELEEMETEIESMDAYHSRWSLYGLNMMDVFLNRLEERAIRPVVLWKLSFQNRQDRKKFLEMAQLLLDERILRFSGKRNIIYLVFVKYQKEEAEKAMNAISQISFTIEKKMVCTDEGQNLWNMYQELLRPAEPMENRQTEEERKG